VTDVQEIEATVGQDNALACATPLFYALPQLASIKDFVR